MSQAVRVITLNMDGRDISARGDQTILQVARENNMYIPTLCHLTGLSRVGACRLCLVEVKGINKLLPACVTRVEEGMEVSLNSERLSKYRRQILELLFSERNHVCAVCVSNGHCELQTLSQTLEMTHVHFPLPVSAPAGGWIARAFCGGSQSLHSVHALRAGVRRNRRRAHVGHAGPGRECPGDHRPQSALGRFGNLHGLRQVHQCLSHRGAGGKRQIGAGNDQTTAIPALSDVNAGETLVSKARVATLWLDGCSGCHMSILDMDERLLELAGKIDVVFGPMVDQKEFPENVDVTLVEGAVSSDEDLEKILQGPRPISPSGLAGRLRGDRQYPVHAESL